MLLGVLTLGLRVKVCGSGVWYLVLVGLLAFWMRFEFAGCLWFKRMVTMVYCCVLANCGWFCLLLYTFVVRVCGCRLRGGVVDLLLVCCMWLFVFVPLLFVPLLFVVYYVCGCMFLCLVVIVVLLRVNSVGGLHITCMVVWFGVC